VSIAWASNSVSNGVDPNTWINNVGPAGITLLKTVYQLSLETTTGDLHAQRSSRYPLSPTQGQLRPHYSTRKSSSSPNCTAGALPSMFSPRSATPSSSASLRDTRNPLPSPKTSSLSVIGSRPPVPTAVSCAWKTYSLTHRLLCSTASLPKPGPTGYAPSSSPPWPSRPPTGQSFSEPP
jgi:hypothetical protein